jgi:hypothetical protein
MSFENANFTPENTQESEDRFAVNTKEGVGKFYEFLTNEQQQLDALDPALDVDALALSDPVSVSLKRLRLEFSDLMRLTKEGLESVGEATSDEFVDSVLEQYNMYLAADEAFSTMYSSESSEDVDILSSNVEKEQEKKVALESVESSDEHSPENEVDEGESKIDTLKLESEATQILKKSIEADYADIKHTYDSVKGQFPFESWSAEVQEIFDTLENYRKEALNIVLGTNEAVADDYIPTLELETKLQTYSRIIENIRDKVDVYVSSADAGLIFSGVEDADVKSNEVQEESTADVNEVPEVLANEHISVVDIDIQTAQEDIENVDTTEVEKKIDQLQQLLKKHPALTVDDRSTLEWNIENLSEKIQAGANAEVLQQALDIADSLMLSQVESPEVVAIVEKSKLLLEKASNFTYSENDEQQTARAMEQILADLIAEQQAGDVVSESKVKQAYQNLENFMIENESKWLKVCGMNIPKAGPEGVFGARSFRDGLELARRNHPDVKDSPENLVIVDKIIQMLFVVPQSGLSEEQVEKVTTLAKDLDVNNKTIEALKDPESEAELSVGESENVSPEASESESYWDMKKRPSDLDVESYYRKENLNYWRNKTSKLLGIEVDSRDDGDIKITVAKKAEEQIDAPDTPASAVSKLVSTPSGEQIVSEVEKRDTINNSVPSQSERSFIKAEAKKRNSLTTKYLGGNPEYMSFFSPETLTEEDFERKLRAAVVKIDEKEIDFFEKNFDNPYQSTFSFLRDMSLVEVSELINLSPAERKDILSENNIKYEAFLTWMDVCESQMLKTVKFDSEMKFEDLFTKWMMEKEMSQFQNYKAAA